MHRSSDVTALLKAWRGGDQTALERLTPLVYDHLRKLGRQYLRKERADARADATSLVHEAYVRLVDQSLPDWRSRDHFYGVAAHLMRQVLVDHARERLSQKRGGGAVRLELDHAADVAAPDHFQPEILAINSALDELARLDARKSKVIELRYFGGCTEEETARLLSLSVATVRRDLRAGEAWLAAHLGGA
jgi:RNA polymerase sigma factor (TIGR02999 family)